MLLQLEQQYLRANLAQAQAFLADAKLDDDPIGQHQFAQLVDELSDKLKTMPGAIEQAPAGVALFFGGRPVVGSYGIHADFSSRALDSFQKIVSQRYAAEELGPLATRGRVPLKDNTHLLITDIVRGSFGFVLQSAIQNNEAEAADTALKIVIDKVVSTLSRLTAQDDMLFDEAVAEIDERQKSTLSEFFKLLDTEGATMRLVEGKRDFELNSESVQRARRRVEQLEITDRTQEFSGQIAGWTDVSAKFELRLYNTHEVIQGSVTTDALQRVAAQGLEPYHKHVRASVKVREVKARNRTTKTAYTLVGLEVVTAPKTWESPAIESPRL